MLKIILKIIQTIWLKWKLIIQVFKMVESLWLFVDFVASENWNTLENLENILEKVDTKMEKAKYNKDKEADKDKETEMDKKSKEKLRVKNLAWERRKPQKKYK